MPTLPTGKGTLPDCYANHFQGCGGGLSREHYITQSVLNVLGDEVRVDRGLPWQGGPIVLPTREMVAKMLAPETAQRLGHSCQGGSRKYGDESGGSSSSSGAAGG